mgnify:CR=1 FL=1
MGGGVGYVFLQFMQVAKRRRRRITLEHIKQHGEFDRQLFEQARRHDTVIYQ